MGEFLPTTYIVKVSVCKSRGRIFPTEYTWCTSSPLKEWVNFHPHDVRKESFCSEERRRLTWPLQLSIMVLDHSGLSPFGQQQSREAGCGFVGARRATSCRLSRSGSRRRLCGGGSCSLAQSAGDKS